MNLRPFRHCDLDFEGPELTTAGGGPFLKNPLRNCILPAPCLLICFGGPVIIHPLNQRRLRGNPKARHNFLTGRIT
jgi:hypothetical protein